MLDYIYCFACLFLPCLLYQLILKPDISNDRRYKLHLLFVYIFLFYIFIIMAILDIGHIWDLSKYSDHNNFAQVNFIPVFPFNFKQFILVALYLPFGFMMPLIWKKYRNAKKTVLLGVLFSSLVEFCQLFNPCISDINSIILCITGTYAGYMIWFLSRNILKKLNDKAVSISENEAITYIWLSISGVFFLYNWNVFNLI